MRIHPLKPILYISIGLLLSVGLHAESVILNNAGFDIIDPAHPVNQTGNCDSAQPCWNQYVNQWTQAGNSGVWNPSLNTGNNGSSNSGLHALSGNYVAYIISDKISQTLSVSGFKNYSVSLAFAARQDQGPSGYDFSVTGEIEATQQALGATVPSVWQLVTLVFNTADVGVHTITVSVTNTGGNQLLVDSTPEPSSLIMLLLGSALAFGAKFAKRIRIQA